MKNKIIRTSLTPGARSNVVLGVPVGPSSLPQLIGQSLQAISRAGDPGHTPFVFACANPHSLSVACQDQVFSDALRAADAVVADGAGLTSVARICRRDVGPRITGSDYFESLMTALDARGGGRVMFFGSSRDVLHRIEARAAREYPQVSVVGMISPPYGEWDGAQDDAFIERINALAPDVLWVGMTAPRQEKWVERNRGRLSTAVIASIGAVFDYYAQTTKRAPRWICDSGLEWAYRLSREPTRLWRRTLVSAPKFVTLVVSEALAADTRVTQRPAADTRL